MLRLGLALVRGAVAWPATVQACIKESSIRIIPISDGQICSPTASPKLVAALHGFASWVSALKLMGSDKP